MVRLLRSSGVAAQFVGLQAPGVLDSPSTWSVQSLAERYVTDVRTYQPEGPYAFVGFCLGGFIAFELAKLLRAHGADVSGSLLVGTVFDYENLDTTPKDVVLRMHLQGLRKWPPVALVDVLPRFTDDEALAIAERDPSNVNPGDEELIFSELTTYWKLINAAGHYEASVSDVPVKLLLGNDPHSPAAETYWRDHASGPFTMHHTPAPHEGLLASRAVPGLIEQMVARR